MGSCLLNFKIPSPREKASKRQGAFLFFHPLPPQPIPKVRKVFAREPFSAVGLYFLRRYETVEGDFEFISGHFDARQMKIMTEDIELGALRSFNDRFTESKILIGTGTIFFEMHLFFIHAFFYQEFL